MTNYKVTPEHRKHLSEAIKQWWSIPTNRERMCLAHHGPGHSGGKGWHHTAEAKDKICLTHIGKPHPYKQNIGWKISKSGRRNMSKAQKRRWKMLKSQ